MGWGGWWWCKVIIVSNPTAVEVALSCIEVVVGVLTIGPGKPYRAGRWNDYCKKLIV